MSTKLRLNPATGKLQLVDVVAAAGAESTLVSSVYTCEATAAVGDWVHLSTTIDGKVIVNIDNLVDTPTIGLILSKPTTTTCRVGLYGDVSGYGLAGLTMGREVFLSSTGTETPIAPLLDYIQILGLATSSTSMFLNPQIQRLRRV